MERITHQGRLIEVLESEVTESGEVKTFEYARRSPGVRLIIPQGNTVLLSKEFRHEVGGYDYRLPGGKVYDSLREYKEALASGADIAEAARVAAIKEAREEVGIEVKDISFFHKSICGATVVWDLFYFVVKEFEQFSQQLEHGEDITIEAVDRAKANELCLDGTMSEERSALVLLRYLSSS